MIHTIKNKFYEIGVTDYGAELVSLKTNNGFEHIWHNTKDYWSDHAPLLFPICGRLKNSTYTLKGKSYHMPMHGFAYTTDFKLMSKEENKITFSLSSNDSTKKMYPFDFVITAAYELRDDKLIFTFTVKNCGDEKMPYMFGWHPGFNLPNDAGQDINDYELDLGKDSVIWHMLPKGETNRVAVDFALDNSCYRLCEEQIYEQDTMIFTGQKNQTKLFSKGHPYLLEMTWTENLPTLCVWKWPKNDAKYICIEPWGSLPKDGITDENFDLRPMPRLMPGETDVYEYSVKISY